MKRILFGLLLGVLMVPAIFSRAMAQEPESAKIEGPGPFTCHSADGEMLEPKYAIIEGAYFNNLPADREDCYAAVDRGIALCEENTRFEAEHDNQKYAGCLPIFEKRARECAVSFREQRYKCDAGSVASGGADDSIGLSREQRRQIQERLAAEGFDPGGEDGTFGPRTREAIREWQIEQNAEATGNLTEQQARALLEGGGSRIASLSPKCSELPGKYPDVSGDSHASAQCWQELDGRPGCFAYRDHYHSGDSIRMSGECRGGVAARGTLTIEWGGGGRSQGPYVDSKRNGDWVSSYQDGTVAEGSIVDGKYEGRWIWRSPDGSTFENCFRANERVDC